MSQLLAALSSRMGLGSIATTGPIMSADAADFTPQFLGGGAPVVFDSHRIAPKAAPASAAPSVARAPRPTAAAQPQPAADGGAARALRAAGMGSSAAGSPSARAGGPSSRLFAAALPKATVLEPIKLSETAGAPRRAAAAAAAAAASAASGISSPVSAASGSGPTTAVSPVALRPHIQESAAMKQAQAQSKAAARQAAAEAEKAARLAEKIALLDSRQEASVAAATVAAVAHRSPQTEEERQLRTTLKKLEHLRKLVETADDKLDQAQVRRGGVGGWGGARRHDAGLFSRALPILPVHFSGRTESSQGRSPKWRARKTRGSRDGTSLAGRLIGKLWGEGGGLRYAYYLLFTQRRTRGMSSAAANDSTLAIERDKRR